MPIDTEAVNTVNPSVANGHPPQGHSYQLENGSGDGSSSRGSPMVCDPWIYRMVVGLLGIVMVTGISGALILALDGKDKVPDIFLALGSAAVGALAGILAPSPDKR